MCFTFGCSTGLLVRATVLLLSHQTIGFLESETPNSLIRVSIHMISAVAEATALYSASVLDLEMVDCFFVHQEIGVDPMNTQYPEVDLLSSGSLAQSASLWCWLGSVDIILKVVSFQGCFNLEFPHQEIVLVKRNSYHLGLWLNKWWWKSWRWSIITSPGRG